jgi:hypothetical protein
MTLTKRKKEIIPCSFYKWRARYPLSGVNRPSSLPRLHSCEHALTFRALLRMVTVNFGTFFRLAAQLRSAFTILISVMGVLDI